MALRHRWPFNGKRYIGNVYTNEVHDLELEDPNGACKIDSLNTGYIKTFFPDTFMQAKSEGFVSCIYCIGSSSK